MDLKIYNAFLPHDDRDAAVSFYCDTLGFELRNDVGLLSEEYDPKRKRLVGNFPQALSHIALVNSAFNLSHHHGPAKDRSEKEAEGS